MTKNASTRGVAACLLAASLATFLMAAVGVADPIHRFGQDGAWRHEHSGWLFPLQVGALTRSITPYSIDGNNNEAGAWYEASEPKITAIVEIFDDNSAAAESTLAGAKAAATRKAGEGARVESERPYQIGAGHLPRGVKVTYAGSPAAEQTSLYFFETTHWRVKVFTQGSGPNADRTIDAFVQALPWDTLASDPGNLH